MRQQSVRAVLPSRRHWETAGGIRRQHRKIGALQGEWPNGMTQEGVVTGCRGNMQHQGASSAAAGGWQQVEARRVKDSTGATRHMNSPHIICI